MIYVYSISLFFLIAVNWQFTLCPSLTASSHSSAGCSLHHLSPPRRGSSCTLHAGCAPCAQSTTGEVKGAGSVWALIHCWLITQTHTHTARERERGKCLLSLTFTQSYSREAAETPGWGVGDGGQWVLSGGGNLTGLPTRWKHSASPLPLTSSSSSSCSLFLCSIHHLSLFSMFYPVPSILFWFAWGFN